jgi:hypothetical protein
MAQQHYINPIDTPVDQARLGGVLTPGYCEVVGASSPRNYEEMGGGGWSGALVIFKGLKPSHFSLRLTLYTTDDWNAWIKFRPLVHKPPIGKRPAALDIVHPFLADCGITSCVIEDVRAPDQVDHGVWMVEIMCIESRKLKAGSVAIDGSDATQVDPREEKLKKLTAERDKKRDALANEGNNP